MPAHRAAVARGERLDPFRGDVRIRRREVDEEIDRRTGSSRQRAATRRIRPQPLASSAQRRRIDEVARTQSNRWRCSRRPARAAFRGRSTYAVCQAGALRRGEIARVGGDHQQLVRRDSRAGRASGRPPAIGLVGVGTARPRGRSPTAGRAWSRHVDEAARRCRSTASRSGSARFSRVSPATDVRARDRGGARRRLSVSRSRSSRGGSRPKRGSRVSRMPCGAARRA